MGIKSMIHRYDKDMPVMKLYAHQQEMVAKYKGKDEIALFLEMGCGKSLTTLRIAQEKYKAGEIDSMLVIAPNDVHKQWYSDVINGVSIDGVEQQELSIDVEAQCVGGRGGSDKLYPFETDYFKFVSVNVDRFSQPTKWKDVVEWANSQRCMIVLDEATCIKNPDSKRSQRILYEFNNVQKRGKSVISSKKISPCRCVLTGTPVTNGSMDLWSIFEFLKPNFFGLNYFAFRQKYAMLYSIETNVGRSTRQVPVLLTEKIWNAVKKCESYNRAFYLFGVSEDTYKCIKMQNEYSGSYKHIDELKEKIKDVATFKKLTEVVDMPKQIYYTREVGLSDNQKKAYKEIKSMYMTEYKGKAMSASNALVLSCRLQQISSGFIVNTDDQEDYTSKEVVWLDKTNPKLDALIRDVENAEKPVLILTNYTAEAEKIYELCKELGYKTGLFTGWRVEGGVEAFKKGELDVLVANTSKIARGFNLQISHTTLFYSNSFSMEARQQAEFRTFRIGQQDVCVYVDYIASGIDKVVMNALKMKKGLLDYIRDEGIEKTIKDVID